MNIGCVDDVGNIFCFWRLTEDVCVGGSSFALYSWVVNTSNRLHKRHNFSAMYHVRYVVFPGIWASHVHRPIYNKKMIILLERQSYEESYCSRLLHSLA